MVCSVVDAVLAQIHVGPGIMIDLLLLHLTFSSFAIPMYSGTAVLHQVQNTVTLPCAECARRFDFDVQASNGLEPWYIRLITGWLYGLKFRHHV